MNITLRNLPDELVKKLKSLAKKTRRSLNSEILFLLESSVSSSSGDFALTTEEQNKQIAALGGTWQDDRSTKEIIEDIYQSRSLGRDIEL